MSYSNEVIFHFIRAEIIVEILNLLNAPKHSLADKLVYLAVTGRDEEYRKIIENLMGEGVSMTTDA
jgi:predicted transcriptional regulator